MTKISNGSKIFKGKENSGAVTAHIFVSHCYLLTWVKQYEHNGVEAFVRRYTNYTKAFKLDVLNYMAEHGTSLYETAAIFKITAASSIRN